MNIQNSQPVIRAAKEAGINPPSLPFSRYIPRLRPLEVSTPIKDEVRKLEIKG